MRSNNNCEKERNKKSLLCKAKEDYEKALVELARGYVGRGIKSENLEVLDFFIDKGVNLNGDFGYFGGSMLFNAMRSKSTRVIEYLLEKGVDIDCYFRPSWGNARGKTPLYWAAVEEEDGEMTKLLLKKGADPNKKSRIYGRFNRSIHTCTPLEAVIFKFKRWSDSHLDLVKLLGYYGASFGLIFKDDCLFPINVGDKEITKYTLINNKEHFDIKTTRFIGDWLNAGVFCLSRSKTIDSLDDLDGIKRMISDTWNFRKPKDSFHNKVNLLIDSCKQNEANDTFALYLALALKDDVDNINKKAVRFEKLFVYHLYKAVIKNVIDKNNRNLTNALDSVDVKVEAINFDQQFRHFLMQFLEQLDKSMWVIGANKALKKVKSDYGGKRERLNFLREKTKPFELFAESGH